MKPNAYVYPTRIAGREHFVLSATGMVKLAEAVEATNPAAARELREAAQQRVDDAKARLRARDTEERRT